MTFDWLASLTWAASGDGRDKFAQLTDQDCRQVGFAHRRFAVSALERRLKAGRLGTSGDQRRIVTLGLLQQSQSLVLTAFELFRTRIAQLGAKDHEGNEQLLAITTQSSRERA